MNSGFNETTRSLACMGDEYGDAPTAIRPERRYRAAGLDDRCARDRRERSVCNGAAVPTRGRRYVRAQAQLTQQLTRRVVVGGPHDGGIANGRILFVLVFVLVKWAFVPTTSGCGIFANRCDVHRSG